MAYEQILADTHDDVLLLTLNRPEKMNAWTRQMMAELADAIESANDDPAIGAIVVTGAGRGFCGGADIGGEFAKNLEGTPREEPRLVNWVELVRTSKPMVAAVNGAAVGIGLTMVLPMDYIVAAEGAKLSARFVKMGLVPELASSHYLVQRCGWGAASDVCLSGRLVEASEAAEIGLVDQVVAPDELLDAAMARARSYGENPSPQLRMIKQLLSLNGAEPDTTLVQRRELEKLEEAYQSPEHKEAVAAFLEKRPPNFRA
jgi:2-(1,2-epoxy-1,2-dihydrophenyl)acetyl-CoA isomerase